MKDKSCVGQRACKEIAKVSIKKVCYFSFKFLENISINNLIS